MVCAPSEYPVCVCNVLVHDVKCKTKAENRIATCGILIAATVRTHTHIHPRPLALPVYTVHILRFCDSFHDCCSSILPFFCWLHFSIYQIKWHLRAHSHCWPHRCSLGFIYGFITSPYDTTIYALRNDSTHARWGAGERARARAWFWVIIIFFSYLYLVFSF